MVRKEVRRSRVANLIAIAAVTGAIALLYLPLLLG
jgi:hypothetical protein